MNWPLCQLFQLLPLLQRVCYPRAVYDTETGEGASAIFSNVMAPIVFQLLFAGVFGAVIGSFAGCCIHRVPRGQDYTYSDEELDRLGDAIPPPPPFNEPLRSQCPKCENILLWWHNIPILSWLLLRRRCYFCKAPIPARYFIVELVSALIALALVTKFGISPTFFLLIIYVESLLVLTYIDLDYFILPDVITLPSAAIALAIGLANSFYPILDRPIVSGWLEVALGFLVGPGMIWLIGVVYELVRKRSGLGQGDIKLLLTVGFLFGPIGSLFAIFVGSLLGAILGPLMLLWRRHGMNEYIPFGPFLAAAIVVYLFSGYGEAPPFEWLP